MSSWMFPGSFVAVLVLGSVALAQSAGRIEENPSGGGFGGRLAFQLYSSRNFPPVSAQLSELRALGYRAVEFGPPSLENPEEMKNLLRDNGMTSPSGHFDLVRLRDDLDGCVALARLFQMKDVVVPWLAEDQRPTDAAGWTALGTELEGFAAELSAAGLRLAWHSHDFELKPLPDGSLPIEHLFAAAPSLRWQPDIGWMQRAGVDIPAWLTRYRDRIVSVHLKDVAPAGAVLEGGWADVGFGVVDWAAVAPILDASPAELFIVEHDEPLDYRRFARRSFETVAGWD